MKSKKILKIILAVVLSVIICLAIVLTVLFCPRKISSYLRVKADDVIEIYVEAYDHFQDAEGRWQESHERRELSPKDYEGFLKQLKSITVTPKYQACKCASRYGFYLVTADATYDIDGIGISAHNKSVAMFRDNVDGEMKALLSDYGLLIVSDI